MSERRLTLVSTHLCPFVQRVSIVLSEKGIPFERVYVDLADKPDWFVRLSPLGKVPLLRIERPPGAEVVLFESAVISEFLEETEPEPPLHPADPLERALHRGWMEFSSSVFADLWAIQTAADSETLAARTGVFRDRMLRLEDVLTTGPYFAGDRFSLVDAFFAPALRTVSALNAITEADLLPTAPRLAAWSRAVLARPSVISAVPADYLSRLEALLQRQNGYLIASAA
ncbi:MAG: glutathione S-transferase family protein [Bauldia sp.]|nr:glutathione S-transferase family protein [Bauldia sp.]